MDSVSVLVRLHSNCYCEMLNLLSSNLIYAKLSHLEFFLRIRGLLPLNLDVASEKSSIGSIEKRLPRAPSNFICVFIPLNWFWKQNKTRWRTLENCFASVAIPHAFYFTFCFFITTVALLSDIHCAPLCIFHFSFSSVAARTYTRAQWQCIMPFSSFHSFLFAPLDVCIVLEIIWLDSFTFAFAVQFFFLSSSSPSFFGSSSCFSAIYLFTIYTSALHIIIFERRKIEVNLNLHASVLCAYKWYAVRRRACVRSQYEFNATYGARKNHYLYKTRSAIVEWQSAQAGAHNT